MRDALVDVLAVHRLTRLVTADVITRPARVAFIRRQYRDSYGTGDNWAWDERSESEWESAVESDDDAPKLAALVMCRWCTSIWMSLGVVAARRYAPVLWEPLAKVLAFSTVAVLVSDLEQ